MCKVFVDIFICFTANICSWQIKHDLWLCGFVVVGYITWLTFGKQFVLETSMLISSRRRDVFIFFSVMAVGVVHL